LVVLILVMLWIAVLAPRLVRHFREGRSRYSVETFHEQLHLLGRTGPKLVEPAFRLEVPESTTPSRGLAVVQGAGSPRTASAAVHGLRHRRSSWEQRRSRRRRRDVLLGLLVFAVATGALGAIHALHLLWALTGISALALAGYVALVAYAQMLHADRDAVRPVASRAPQVDWVSRRDRPTRPAVASQRGFFTVVNERSPLAARAGYPGAWDDERLVDVGASRVASGR
jgi:hypothetical protein